MSPKLFFFLNGNKKKRNQVDLHTCIIKLALSAYLFEGKTATAAALFSELIS